jgi:hypothetical protein
VVGSDAPETGIAGVEAVFTGNGTHSGITDDDGYFFIDTINSNSTYLITIEVAGYQDYVGEAVIGDDNVDLGDLVLTEYVFPAYDVTAVQNEYETEAEIRWHSPEQAELISYSLYILLWGDEENEEDWINIASGLADTVYVDLSWETMPWAVYRYAVKVMNANNTPSEAAFSNWLGRDMYATLELSFTTNMGAVPEGALVMLNSTEPDPDGNYPAYEAVTDEIGDCVISDVWRSNYDITGELEGYSLFESNIDIYEDTVIYNGMFVLEYPPAYNVHVIENHSGNAWLTWHAPEENPVMGYSIYRGFAADQVNYEDWNFIASTFLDTTYEDTSWPYVTEPGEYMYCVRVNQIGGVQTEPAFSNIIFFDTNVPVTINISCNSDDSTDGAEVNLCNQDGVHCNNGIVSGGVVSWDNVLMGVYDLDVTFPGYETYLETDIWIVECSVLNVVLAELINPPVNLEYYPGTGILTWDAPEIDGNLSTRHFEYYNVYLDNELIDQTVDQMYDLISLINPDNEYIAGVSANYSSNQESEIIEITIPALAGGENTISTLETCLYGNYPNPFNPVTNIEYVLAEDGKVKIEIYNIKGQMVETLVDDYLEAGKHIVVWQAEEMASGIFLLRFESCAGRDVRKITLLK